MCPETRSRSKPSRSPVAATHAGAAPLQRLERVLRTQLEGASWNTVRELIRSGKVFVAGQVVLDVAALVALETPLEVRMTAPRPRSGALASDAVVFVDNHVVVVRKPAGLSSVPHENETTSLQEQTERLLRSKLAGTRVPTRNDDGGRLYAVHRLDKVSSGVLVFARHLQALRALKEQFREHSVERRYLALVHGQLGAATLRSHLVSDRGDQRRGSTHDVQRGQLAVTHVTPRERLARCTLLECRLETGRTHQIRIQLAEHGHPLVGERVYVGSPELERSAIEAPRTLLHAAELSFAHPMSGEALHFAEPLPEDFTLVLERERKRRP